MYVLLKIHTKISGKFWRPYFKCSLFLQFFLTYLIQDAVREPLACYISPCCLS